MPSNSVAGITFYADQMLVITRSLLWIIGDLDLYHLEMGCTT